MSQFAPACSAAHYSKLQCTARVVQAGREAAVCGTPTKGSSTTYSVTAVPEDGKSTEANTGDVVERHSGWLQLKWASVDPGPVGPVGPLVPLELGGIGYGEIGGGGNRWDPRKGQLILPVPVSLPSIEAGIECAQGGKR